MKRLLSLLGLASVVLAVPARAGVYLSAATTTDAANGPGAVDAAVRVWADGDRARVEFASSRDAELKPGRYLLTLNGGAAVYLVDPEKKTFTRWDPVSLVASGGGVAAAHGGKAKLIYTGPKLEKLADKDGGLIAGVATRLLRYRITYTVAINEMGVQTTSSTQLEESLWIAPKLTDAALGVWLVKAPRKTGDDKLDAAVAAVVPSYEGFPLKRVTVATTTDGEGRKTVVTNSTTVSQLIEGPMPTGTFAMGSGLKEVTTGPAAPDGMEQKEASSAEPPPPPDRYPFERMLDEPAATGASGAHAGQPGQAQAGQDGSTGVQGLPAGQAGQGGATPQTGQGGTTPQSGQPGTTQPTTPTQPEPEPEPEPEPQPEYPFDRMLDAGQA